MKIIFIYTFFLFLGKKFLLCCINWKYMKLIPKFNPLFYSRFLQCTTSYIILIYYNQRIHLIWHRLTFANSAKSEGQWGDIVLTRDIYTYSNKVLKAIPEIYHTDCFEDRKKLWQKCFFIGKVLLRRKINWFGTINKEFTNYKQTQKFQKLLMRTFLNYNFYSLLTLAEKMK